MKPRHKVSRAGMELIKAFEGFRSSAAQLADGRWTIGYGHTKTARQGAEVSEADADVLLYYDLIEVSAAVNALTFTPLTQNQFDALVSFAFNLGLDAFRRSAVLRAVNEGAMLQAAGALDLWRKADFEGERIVVDALVRRRAAEKVLFLTPPDGWVAAPSPVLPPRLDGDADTASAEQPVDLKASLVGETATVAREDAPAPAAPSAESVDAERAPASQITEVSQALSARLEAILPALEPQPLHSETPVEIPADPLTETPPVTEAPEAAAISDPFSPESVQAEAAAPAAALDDLFPQPIYREEPAPEPDPSASSAARRERLTSTALLLLALLGLVVFAAVTAWVFGVRSNGGVLKATAVGFPVAVAGVACMAWAVYSLITKLGGHDE